MSGATALAPSSVRLPGSLIALGADSADGPATTWIQVLRTGSFWSARYKDFAVTKATLAKMVENFQTITPKAPTELPLDYNHGTNYAETVDQGKAAGWIKNLELRANGTELWAQVELTAEAADLVRGKEYRYVSATFEFDHVHTDGEHRKKAIGPTLMSAALTNTPFVEGMAPVTLAKDAAVMLDADGMDAEPDDDADDTEAAKPKAKKKAKAKTVAMDDDPDQAEADAMSTSDPQCKPAAVAASHPVSGAHAMPTITVKDAQGNDVQLSEEVAIALARQHAPKNDDLKVELNKMQAALTETQTQLAELRNDNAKLKDEKATMAAEQAVGALIKAGKIAPKKRDQFVKLAKNDPETFNELTSDLPVVFAVGTEVGSAGDGEGLTAVQQVAQLTRDAQTANPKLSAAEAQTLVFNKHPHLYEAYKRESTVRV